MFGYGLQFQIKMQPQILARHRRNARQHADGASAGVGLHLIETGAAMQRGFVMLLQSGLADMYAALVILLAVILAQALQVTVIDAPDKAHHVRHARPGQIVAEQACLHLDARQAIAIGGQNRYFLIGQLAL